MNSIFKHTAIFILLAAFLMQLFSNTIIYATFLMQQDYIAKNLCIDKDVKESTCEGKCQLKEELSKNSENNEKPLMTTNEKQEIVFCSCDKINSIEYIVMESRVLPTTYRFSHSLPHLSQLYIPPRA